jgi:hypothetical protein
MYPPIHSRVPASKGDASAYLETPRLRAVGEAAIGRTHAERNGSIRQDPRLFGVSLKCETRRRSFVRNVEGLEVATQVHVLPDRNELGQAEVLRLHPGSVEGLNRQEGHAEVFVEAIERIPAEQLAMDRRVGHIDRYASRRAAALERRDARKLPAVVKVPGEKAVRISESTTVSEMPARPPDCAKQHADASINTSILDVKRTNTS